MKLLLQDNQKYKQHDENMCIILIYNSWKQQVSIWVSYFKIKDQKMFYITTLKPFLVVSFTHDSLEHNLRKPLT